MEWSSNCEEFVDENRVWCAIEKNQIAKQKDTGRIRIRTGDLSHAKGTRYQLRHTPWKILVPSGIEPLILAFIEIY